MPDRAETLDVAVIGAGPAGLTAGLYAARAGLRTVVFGDRYGSQLSRAEIVENYPTQIDPLSGMELIERFASHAIKFSAELNDQEIRQIKRDEALFQLFTNEGRCFPAYTVVLAMGTKRRLLGVKGEQEYYGQGVAFCTICDGPLFRQMPVAVIGSGDEGAAAAMRMSAIATSVDLLVPSARLDADTGLEQQVRKLPNVRVTEGIEVQEIIGDSSGVTGMRIRVGGQEELIEVQGVFLELGLLPASSLAMDLGVELSDEQFVRVRQDQQTNVEGVFAAGDITGHWARQSVISAGEGATAAVAAIDYIKSHGLGGVRKDLKLIQWGTTKAPPSPPDKQMPEGAPVAADSRPRHLLEYVQTDTGYAQLFQAYDPDVETIRQVRQALPQAKVMVIAARWCPDCRRNVPKLARISEHLPEWDFSVFPRESEEAHRLDTRAVPTIAVFAQDTGAEIGRIVEDPHTGSLEKDLLEIATSSEASPKRSADTRDGFVEI